MLRFKTVVMMALVLCIASMFSACSGRDGTRSARRAWRYINEHDLKTLPRSDIPLEMNERVVAWMRYFEGAGRRHFERYLARSGRYMPMMLNILKERGMPQDLVYIALIESGFNDNARSHANAVGAWQFIGSTGRIYGLKIDAWTDERRDPHKATHAAAKFFADLYDQFGDWYLAMAGYNAGPGRVRRAINMTDSRNFWDHANHNRALAAETRDYVPKYIAATIMAKNPEKFGFKNIEYEKPLDYEFAEVETQTDLSVVARCSGVSEDEISMLNAHLIRGATPPDVRNYTVKIPRGTSKTFRLAYAKVPEQERVNIARLKPESDTGGGGRRVVRYTVKRGDTLSRIASRYRGVSVANLRRWNNLGAKSHIRVGQRLRIYTSGGGAVASGGSAPASGSTRTFYTVKSGETIGGIAARHGVSTNNLMAWNNMRDPKSLRAGQRIRVSPEQAASGGSGTSASAADPSRATATHTLLSGETLYSIALKYGMTANELMVLNDIKNPRRVRAGTRLRVYGEAPAPQAQAAGETTAVKLDRAAPAGGSAAQTSGGTHTLKSGETLGHVAERYGVSTANLMALNNINDARRVRAGTKLRISGGRAPEASAGATTSVKPEGAEPAGISAAQTSGGTHTLKSGETLGHVAERYGVSTANLMAWNNIKDARRVRAGTRLRVVSGGSSSAAPRETPQPQERAAADVGESPVAPSASSGSGAAVKHTVKSGETLWTIARIHRVTIAQLQEWNNLDDPSSVRAGTTLKVIKN